MRINQNVLKTAIVLGLRDLREIVEKGKRTVTAMRKEIDF